MCVVTILSCNQYSPHPTPPSRATPHTQPSSPPRDPHLHAGRTAPSLARPGSVVLFHSFLSIVPSLGCCYCCVFLKLLSTCALIYIYFIRTVCTTRFFLFLLWEAHILSYHCTAPAHTWRSLPPLVDIRTLLVSNSSTNACLHISFI